MKRRLFVGFTLLALLVTFAAVGHTAAQPKPYTDNGDGTVTQNATGLVWQKTDDGTLRIWQAAMDYCNNNTAGLPGSGWRLPNKDELKTVSGSDVFNGKPSNYWSASSIDDYAWYVHFYYGRAVNYEKQYPYYVRCVR